MPSAVTVLAHTPLEALIGELPGRVALLVAEGSPREIKDAADYLRTQLRRAGLAFEVRNAAAQAWLELEAGCGAKLAGKLAVGAPPKTVSRPDSFRLKDVGISRNLSVRMQAIAAIPQRVRAQYYKTAQDSGWEITWGGRDGLEARAAADHYELNRTRPRAAADQYYQPAGTGSDRDRPDEKKRYWLTPPELLKEWQDEFNAGEPFFDPCPYPRPPDFDGLDVSWEAANYVNPLFHNKGDGNGVTDWARKAISENQLGKLVVLVIPATPQATNVLLAAGAEARSLQRVKWLEATTGEPMPSPGNVTMFILRPSHPSAYYNFDRTGERTEYFTRANNPAWKIRSPKRLPYFHNDPELSTQANKNHGIAAPSVQRHEHIGWQPRVDLWQGDCLTLMDKITDHSIDLILADLPYGEQRLPWDTAIDLDALWQHYRRILKPNRPVLLFGGMPFGAALIASNQSWFKYNLIWLKRRAADFIHANNRPMTFHDEIQVFSQGAIATTKKSSRRMPYYPANVSTRPLNNPDGYPRSVIEFVSEESHHPTPKPVALLSYLIELYSMPEDSVLDNTMGSGSTGVAALRSGRNFIGIEQHKPFFDVACGRLNTDIVEAAD